jgi:hypothetical protein
MSFMSKMFSKAITTKANEEIRKKPSLFKLIASTPEDFKLEAWIENEEVVIKIKKKGEKIDGSN